MKRYEKDLTETTTFRCSQQLRSDAEEAAQIMHLSFSQFIRQSIRRNINIALEVEREVSNRLIHKAMGKP